MLKLLLPLLSLCTLSSALAQDSLRCPLGEDLRAKYSEDLARLALDRLYAVGSPDTASVEIPSPVLDSVASDFATIYHSTSPQRDTVFGLYCMRNLGYSATFVDPVYAKGVLASVGDDTTWTEAFFEGQEASGNSAIDSVVARYELEVRGVREEGGDYLVFTSSVNLHIRPIVELLARQPAIDTSYGLSDFAGDGDYYAYAEVDRVPTYAFGLGWGDCPAGCTGRREWRFSVDTSCGVQFVGAETVRSTPQPLPAGKECATIDLDEYGEHRPAAIDLEVFPNPVDAGGSIDLRIGGLPATGILVRVIDAMGRVHVRRQTSQGQLRIRLADLSAGLYYVEAVGNTSRGLRPFVIE